MPSQSTVPSGGGSGIVFFSGVRIVFGDAEEPGQLLIFIVDNWASFQVVVIE